MSNQRASVFYDVHGKAIQAGPSANFMPAFPLVGAAPTKRPAAPVTHAKLQASTQYGHLMPPTHVGAPASPYELAHHETSFAAQFHDSMRQTTEERRAMQSTPTPQPKHTYLGETPVDLSQHPVYGKYTGVEWALLFRDMYGGIDGAHHKDWVMDQMTRLLKGTPMTATLAKWSNGEEEMRFVTGEPSKEYLAWVKAVQDAAGENVEDYDTGIAP